MTLNDVQPSVSIIINTLGRADLLSDTLRGLSALRWPDLEVVVVNGPSRDHTEQVLEAWTPRIKIGHCPEANLSMSRNIGLSLAAGEIVAFIDDDAIPHPAWLEELTAPYRDPRIGGVGGHTIGRLGSAYQARTTLCDRFGDAFAVSRYVDVAKLCEPGSWVFPSLLGTNASFRRAALVEVGGFDETFTYYLEETDLCLRLVDAGWQIAYSPAALVWHQFASSALRSSDATRRSIKSVMRSQAYFINRHGLTRWTPEAAQAAANRLFSLKEDWGLGNRAALASGAIDARHAARLDRELVEGLEAGFRLAQQRAGAKQGHWRSSEQHPFCAFSPPEGRGLTLGFVCRYYLGVVESGIPRWTRLLAHELARRGHNIHIICEAQSPETRISFADGIWTHEILSSGVPYSWITERYGLPAEQAQWAACAREQVEVVRSFGLDLLSFPIWDLEGIACLDEPALAVCMSLHTTYGLSAKFHEDWASRPLFRDSLIAPMIEAEKIALSRISFLLANSRSIVTELEGQTGLNLGGRAELAVHGVPTAPAPTAKRPGLVLFVGRFEPRKGVDIALAAFAAAAQANSTLTAVFAGGGDLDAAVSPELAAKAAALVAEGRLECPGIVSRQELDGLYAVADVALLPSRYESFGLVAAEALANGCVVAALDCGGIAEVVTNGVDGVLVPLNAAAPAALADEVLRLFADASVLSGMQAAARRSAEDRFSLKRMAEDVEAAFSRFVDMGSKVWP